MTKGPEPNRYVMLNLFQHLVCFFLLSADAPFIPVHRTGFSGATLIILLPLQEESFSYFTIEIVKDFRLTVSLNQIDTIVTLLNL